MILGLEKIKYSKQLGEDMIEFETKEGSFPWTATGSQGVSARGIVCDIIQDLEKMGLKFIAPVNIKGSIDTLFFAYNEGAHQRNVNNTLCKI